MFRTMFARALLLAALVGASGACGARPRCDGLSCVAACPHDAKRDASGRCRCTPDNVSLLGACVSPAVGDAFCGAAARFGHDGCTFRTCSAEERLDAVTGGCVRAAAVSPSQAKCGERAIAIVAAGRTTCVTAQATCPRGTRRQGETVNAPCVRPPSCPPGSLPARGGCTPVVTAGVREGVPRVDVGSWSALVLGDDGGPGTLELCSPLALRSDALAAADGAEAIVRIHVTLALPDQDLTRMHVRARTELRTEAGSRALSDEGEAIVSKTIATLVEPLRGLGGESSTAIVEVQVDCKLRNFSTPGE